jgi:hypothetical protein
MVLWFIDERPRIAVVKSLTARGITESSRISSHVLVVPNSKKRSQQRWPAIPSSRHSRSSSFYAGIFWRTLHRGRGALLRLLPKRFKLQSKLLQRVALHCTWS